MSAFPYNRERVLWRLTGIIVEQLCVNREIVLPQSNFKESFCTDSLDEVEILMACEEEFQIEIPDEAVAEVKTVQDAADALCKIMEITQ